VSKSAHAIFFLIAIMMLPLLYANHTVAGELEDAIAGGQKLFADASLGTNGKSCNSCHTNMGKGEIPFTGRAPFPKVFSMAKKMRTLDQVVQGCIMGAMKGNPLAWDDARLTDLVTYVNSLYAKQ
jgi:cytochrome c